jgi:hypothetical protein
MDDTGTEWVMLPEYVCLVSGCEQSGKFTLGYCRMHYLRFWRHGDSSVTLPAGRKLRETPRICDVGSCERVHFSHGYCQKHYQRWRKHGDASIVLQSSTVFQPGHASAARGHPAGPGHPMWKGNDIGYGAAHERVYRLHGKASDWPCSARCGRQAEEWAYCHDAENELYELVKNPHGNYIEVPYSPNPDDYVPLCKPCHVDFDRERAHAC